MIKFSSSSSCDRNLTYKNKKKKKKNNKETQKVPHAHEFSLSAAFALKLHLKLYLGDFLLFFFAQLIKTEDHKKVKEKQLKKMLPMIVANKCGALQHVPGI